MGQINFKTLVKETQFLYWWKPAKKLKLFNRPLNVGDALSVYIVWHVMKEKNIQLASSGNKLLGIGSIMNHAATNDVIWGTGYNSVKNQNAYHFSNLQVKAVRGPLTKLFLESKGIEVPPIYGDPGLLASRYFKKSATQDIEYLFIPHFSESKNKILAPHVLETKGSVEKFIQQITRAKKVISSSLHGLIIAESFGIPAVLLKNNNGEGDEKYHDYYQGTGRTDFPICRTLNEALAITPCKTPNINKIQEDLLNSFPSEI